MERYWVWEYGLFEKNPKRVDSLNPETTLEVVKLADVQATVAALQRERDEAQALVSERASMIGSLTAALDAERADTAIHIETIAYQKREYAELMRIVDGLKIQLAQRGEEVAGLEQEREDLLENLSLCKGNELAAERDELQTDLSQLQALVRALIYSDNAPEHDRAWFALRATLDATPTATPTHNGGA